MRKLLIVEKGLVDQYKPLAGKLGTAEVADGIPPRYAGMIKELPCAVIESRNIPGRILAILSGDDLIREKIEAVQEIPAPPRPKPVDEILADHENRITELEKGRKPA